MAADRPVVTGAVAPVTDSPLRKPGFKAQMVLGTGPPPGIDRMADADLSRTRIIDRLNTAAPARVLRSA